MGALRFWLPLSGAAPAEVDGDDGGHIEERPLAIADGDPEAPSDQRDVLFAAFLQEMADMVPPGSDGESDESGIDDVEVHS